MIKKHWLKIVLALIVLSECFHWAVFFTTAHLSHQQFEVLKWDSVEQNTKIVPLLNLNIEHGVLDGNEPAFFQEP